MTTRPSRAAVEAFEALEDQTDRLVSLTQALARSVGVELPPPPPPRPSRT